MNIFLHRKFLQLLIFLKGKSFISANNRSHSFTLTGNTLGQNAVQSMADSSNCNTDWLIIPCSENLNTLLPRSSNCVDRLCGGTLSAEPSTTSSTIISTPFFHVRYLPTIEVNPVYYYKCIPKFYLCKKIRSDQQNHLQIL